MEVNGGDDAERGDECGHEECHDKGAKDGGEDASLGIGLAGFFCQESEGVVEEHQGALPEGKLIGWVKLDDFSDVLGAFFAGGKAIDELLDFLFCPQVGGLLSERAIALAEWGELGFEVGFLLGIKLWALELEFELADLAVGGSDLVFFEVAKGFTALIASID